MLLSVLLVTSTAHSEVIDGFRDLKFGMSEKDVVGLEQCSTSTECLYELSGKNRYLQPSYSSPPGSKSVATLSRITIDMGAFSDHWYQELQIRLQDNYQLTNDLLDRDIAAFQKHDVSELTSGYERGQILLKVIRRKFGNLILKVIYQNKVLAAETFKEPNLPH